MEFYKPKDRTAVDQRREPRVCWFDTCLKKSIVSQPNRNNDKTADPIFFTKYTKMRPEMDYGM